MNKRVATTVGAALVGGAVIAGAVPALAAVTVNSPPSGMYLHINSPDTISAKGAAVTTTYVVKCPVNTAASLYASVSERSGHSVVTVSGYAGINCTGAKQTVAIYMQASSKPFVVGPASISAQFYDFTQSGNNELDAFGTVQFVK
jgi:hypothetical protein